MIEKTDSSTRRRTTIRKREKKQLKKKSRKGRRRRSTGAGGRELRRFIENLQRDYTNMAPKKEKQNGFTFQEQQDPSNVVFKNSLNSEKRGQQAPPPPLNLKNSKTKPGGEKRPVNSREERSPWK